MPASWPTQADVPEDTSPQKPISLVPKSLDLKLYAGDGVKLRLNVKDSSGDPVNLTGAVTAQIRASRAGADPVATFTTEIIDATGGIALISLSGAETRAIHGDPDPVETFQGVWDVQWAAEGAEPVTLFQGNVESKLDVTRT